MIVFLLTAGTGISDTGNAYVFTDGRGAMPAQSEFIMMDAESVTVTPVASSSHTYTVEVEVECVFYLTNLTDDPLHETVFFPFESFYSDPGLYHNYEAGQDERDEFYYSRTLEMMNSEAGRSVPVEELVPDWLQFRAFDDVEEYEVSYHRGQVNPDMRLVYWPVMACWDMHFKPGETVRLVNTYHTYWKFNQYVEGFASFTYVTRSGATWAGTIGDAVISIVVPEQFSAGVTDRTNQYLHWNGSPAIDGGRLTWHYTDWEPDEDITLTAVWEPNTLFNMLWAGGYSHFNDSLAANWRSGELYPLALEIFSSTRDVLSADDVIGYLERWGCILCGISEPDSMAYFDKYFDQDYEYGVEPGEYPEREIMAVSHALEDLFRQCRETVEAADMEFLLPMTIIRRFPSSGCNMSMYCAVPQKQIAYLLYLENVRDAAAGNTIIDPAVESLFWLSGWYIAGEESPMLGSSDNGIISRAEVTEFWREGGGCGMPLVTGTTADQSASLTQNIIAIASSELQDDQGNDFICGNSVDGDRETCWITGADGYGHGETISLSLREPQDIRGVSIVNGCSEPAADYADYSRVRKIYVSCNETPLMVAQIVDESGIQTFYFPHALTLKPDDVLSFEIVEVYPGVIHCNTAISEIALLIQD